MRKEQKKTTNYYQYLINTLEHWGISLYTGVTGGGVVHFLKHLDQYQKEQIKSPMFLTLGEYTAGFVPLGYYLASGQIAAAIATTGAATDLLTCGLLDAKMHDIPAVYIVPISGKKTEGFSPLQDSSIYGSNIVERLRAILPDSVFLLDDPAALEDKLLSAKIRLNNSKPVVFILDNNALNIPIDILPDLPEVNNGYKFKDNLLNLFIQNLRKEVSGKRLVILIGEDMARYEKAKILTSELCKTLKAAVVWSINGANAIARNNPYGYGYIAFGGNDKAISLFYSLKKDDVLLVLGAGPDEYTVNLSKCKASTFYMGTILHPYGMVEGSFQHMVSGQYTQVLGPLDVMVEALIDAAKKEGFTNNPAEKAPQYLNNYPLPQSHEGYVDMGILYTKLDAWWPANSIGIDDVCLSYKDRQYVTQRPNDNISFYSLYRGSAMGGAFGVAIGAKLSRPDKHVFIFSGDGCFRLYGGSLGEVADQGIVLFLLNNETLSIVEQGLVKIFPDVEADKYHANVRSIDYCGAAKAFGWDSEKLNADMSNLDDILNKIDRNREKSILIEIPVDPHQELGHNPRLKNL